MTSRYLIADILAFLLLFFAGNNSTSPLQMDTDKTYSYLALGDSYTIGETVPLAENFPNQVVRLLNQNGLHFSSPRIIAKTGWTTDELEEGIIASDQNDALSRSYDLVTLLIGVNNQYRDRSVDNYKTEFEELLKKAIAFAGNDNDHVIVISIPDWGVTPFATGRDEEQIAKEIDEYNLANKKIASQYKVHYLDITAWTREAKSDHTLLAADGLHPSAKEYKRWAENIYGIVRSVY